MQTYLPRSTTSQSSRTLLPKKFPSSANIAIDLGTTPKQDLSNRASFQHMNSSKPMGPSSNEKRPSRGSQGEAFLYRFPIPPDLINFFTIHTDRPTTVKIFKNKLEADQDFEDPYVTLRGEKRMSENFKIRQGDDAEAANMILERKMREFEKKKKQKMRGSMFVNDLWGREYEKNVMKAAKIDRELKIQNMNTLKPLEDKFQEIVAVYERKKRRSESVGNLWALKPTRSKMNVDTDKCELVLKTEASPVKRGVSPTSKASSTSSITGNENISTSTGPKTTFVIKTRPANFVKTENDKEKMSLSPFIPTRECSGSRQERVSTTPSTDTWEEIEEKRGSPYRGAQSRVSKRSNFAPKRDFAAWESTLNHIQDLQYTTSPSRNDLQRTSGIFNSGNYAYYNRSEIYELNRRKSDQDERNEAFDEIIQKCNTELEEKAECLVKIGKIERLFQPKKKNFEKMIRDKRKLEIIADCKYMLEKRDRKNTKVPTN